MADTSKEIGTEETQTQTQEQNGTTIKDETNWEKRYKDLQSYSAKKEADTKAELERVSQELLSADRVRAQILPDYKTFGEAEKYLIDGDEKGTTTVVQVSEQDQVNAYLAGISEYDTQLSEDKKKDFLENFNLISKEVSFTDRLKKAKTLSGIGSQSTSVAGVQSPINRLNVQKDPTKEEKEVVALQEMDRLFPNRKKKFT